MNVTVNGREISFPSQDKEQILEAFGRLFKELYESNEIVQEVVIDGKPCHDQYHDVLVQRAETIRDVQIATRNGDQLMAEMEEELGQYLPRLIRGFATIPDLLYGEMKESDWQSVGQLIEGMQWVFQSTSILSEHHKRFGKDDAQYKPYNDFLQRIVQPLTDLEANMQSQDFTAVGDLLKYELAVIVADLHQSMTSGVSHDQA